MEIVKRYKRFFNKLYYNIFIENFNKKIDYNTPLNIHRWDVVNLIIKKYKFNNYLEIGCDEDQLFSKVEIKNKIGVDPKSGGNLRLTSDKFFEKNDKYFDIVFIDGLHEYDQVINDIENSLKYLNKEGFILIHDCLPRELSHQAVPRYRHFWNGDVWKAIVKFRTRKDLNIFTCNIETGIAIIQKKDNEDHLNFTNLNFKQIKFKDYYHNYRNYMRIIEYDIFIQKFLSN